ncbi:MAG: hypothetical protein PHE53_13880, partial [Thermoguttaceae bacterium]|nr:hypothetical protein [Thermoguttaceae bacterium]
MGTSSACNRLDYPAMDGLWVNAEPLGFGPFRSSREITNFAREWAIGGESRSCRWSARPLRTFWAAQWKKFTVP